MKRISIPFAHGLLASSAFVLFLLIPIVGRAVPLDIVVTNNNGDNSPGSLGDAINQINANVDGGTIDLSAIAGQTIDLTAPLPALNAGVTILNTGSLVSINGDGISQVFDASSSITADITGVAVYDASVTGTSNLVVDNNGPLYVIGSYQTGNSVSILSDQLTISDSTLQLSAGAGLNSGAAGVGGAVGTGNYTVGGSFNAPGGSGQNTAVGGGDGGSAAVSTGPLTVTSGSALNLLGGAGASGGDAGTGGAAYSTYYAQGSTFTSGDGGDQNQAGNGGDSGSEAVTAGAVSLDDSSINLEANAGGNGGNAGSGGDVDFGGGNGAPDSAVTTGNGGVSNVGGNGGAGSSVDVNLSSPARAARSRVRPKGAAVGHEIGRAHV